MENKFNQTFYPLVEVGNESKIKLYLKNMKKYLGFITGFIFGLLAVLMAATGLVAGAGTGKVLAAFLAPFFFRPVASWLVNLGGDKSIVVFPIAILFNGLFFGLIGFLIQKYLRIKNKNESVVVYIFLLIVLLFILALFFECGIIKTCMA